MKYKIPLTQFLKNCLALVFIGLNLISLSACGQKTSSDFYWYEEAKQDDGSIIVVKKSNRILVSVARNLVHRITAIVGHESS
jgi:hypothetical protein